MTTPTAKTFTVSGGITLRDPPTLFGEGSKVIHAGQAGGTTSPLELYRSDAAAPGAKPEQLTDAATTVSTVFVSRDGARIACGFQSVHGIATDGPLPVKPTLIAQDVTHGGFFGDGKRLVWTTAPSGGRIRFETADLAGAPPWTPAIVLDAALSSSGTTTSALRSGLRELVLVQGSLFLVDASGALSVKEIATGVFSAAWAGKNIVYTTGNVGTTEVSLFAPDDGSRRSLSALANVKPGSVFPTTDVGTIGFVVSEPDGKESGYAVDLASPKPLRVTTAALRSAKGVALR